MTKYMKGLVVAVALIMLFSSVGAAQNMIQIKGSDTLINLVQTLAEQYMEKHPQAMIAVTGGGSGTGIAALIDGKCDISDASRPMEDKEIQLAGERGVDPRVVVIGIDGLSVITNMKNLVTKLTMDQIGAMFRSEITNWKDVGGKDKPITLYGRQSNSGTFVFFAEHVLKGDYSPKMNRMNGNTQIVESVRQDETGIGYVGVGYVKDAEGITVLYVAAQAGGEYTSPLETEAVETGRYPVARPLFQYVNGMPTGAVKDFIAFEIGPEGQRIIEEEGFFPVTGEYQKGNKKNIGM
ncbi:MAG: PstS family phosphate ABC transporter substrate-binding protein [bacterium]